MRDAVYFAAVPASLALVRRFELHVLFNDLRNISFGHFHVPQPFGPNHHIGTERADIQTTRPDHANLAFEIAFLGHFAQLFDDLFGAAVTARRAFTVTVVDADMNLGLRPLNHRISLRDECIKLVYSKKNNSLHALLGGLTCRRAGMITPAKADRRVVRRAQICACVSFSVSHYANKTFIWKLSTSYTAP